MLTCSTTYHRGNWGRRTRAWLRRLDHSSIFVLIAGTYTPFCMLALEDKTAQRLLVGNAQRLYELINCHHSLKIQKTSLVTVNFQQKLFISRNFLKALIHVSSHAVVGRWTRFSA